MKMVDAFLRTLQRRVDERIRPHADRAGFSLVGLSRIDDGTCLLEYRRRYPDRPPLLLDITVSLVSSRITAELWSPSDLAHVSATTTSADMARRSTSWPIDASADPSAPADGLAAEVETWLEAIEPASVEG